jgi:AraC family transcriptional regulator, positive regulator of tynA and feaB
MELHEWSTDAIRPGLRLEYWVGAVCQAFLEMDCDPRARSGFEGRITQVNIGELGFHRVISEAQDMFRTPAGIARSSRQPYYLLSLPHQCWQVRQDGKLLHLRPGDLVLIDSSRPYALNFPERSTGMSVCLPRPFVNRWLVEPERTAPRLVARNQGWGTPLSALCVALVQEPMSAGHYPPELLSDHLGAMLSAALDPPDATRSAGGNLVDRAIAYLREQLAQPGIVARAAADELGISVRTLHRAFSAQGRSFGGTLRKLRLEEAQRLLEAPFLARLSVSEVGRRCGFADASHFVREFHQATGMTPGHLRKIRGVDGTPVP